MPDKSPASDRPTRRFDPAAWRPLRSTWLWVLLAIAAGLLLFLLALPERDDGERATVDAPPTADDRGFTPLPAPLPAGEDRGASGMDRERRAPREPEREEERPRLVETPPPLEPEASAETPAEMPAAAVSDPVAIPGQTPAPRYPIQALRRGDRGTVLVLAEIGADGIPTSVSVARGSGSRALDRAAVNAVRRWRFRPAEADGEPTTGTVQVPIEFNP